MAMFDNLKNLIRSKASITSSPSKAATKMEASDDINPSSSINTMFHSGDNQSVISQNTTPSSTHSDDTADPKPPVYKELASRYEIIEKLGEGAFSKVFKAIDHEYNSQVAIKVIDKTSMSKSQIEGVFKEISIMRRLDHPNVVKLNNYINTPKNTFLVIEYVSGGELFNQIVKYTYFSEDLARHIIIQVVKAVDYLHSEVGVVHRDIKPENILFEKIEFTPSSNSPSRRKSDDDSKLDEGAFRLNVGGAGIGRIKIADFGLSKILWDSNTKTPCGTASYTAPEIVKDEAYSKSVDMWAVGCVLYTLLCGFPPFYDTDPKTLTLKVSKGEYTFLSPWWDEISKEAKDLVSHLLTVDPIQRYGPDEVLNDPWILNNSKPTLPAVDSPVYKTKNPSILRFEETIPSIHQMPGVNYNRTLSPRAEALKFAFDTGISIQRTATPLRRLNDEYFDESDDEEDDDDSEDSDDSDDSDDGGFDSDNDEGVYTYQSLSTPQKGFPKGLSTPNHCTRRRVTKGTPPPSKFQRSSTSSLQVPQSRLKAPKPVRIEPDHLSLDKASAKQSHFKEIDGFNLNFDGNTLLNRRKMSGSLACGPFVK